MNKMYQKLSLLFMLSRHFSSQSAIDLPRLNGYVKGIPRADISQAPYQASVVNGLLCICGGAIISPDYVLTTAQCVDKFLPKEIVVRAGSELSTSIKNGIAVRVCSIKKHEHYNPVNNENDIAVLKLCHSLPISKSIKTVNLHISHSIYLNGRVATLSGFGKETGSLIPRTLRVTQTPLVNPAMCLRLYQESGLNTETMHCANDTNPNFECQGLIAGSLVLEGMLIGLQSYGYGCDKPTYPTVFTRVSYFRDWIRKNSNV